MQGVGSVNWCYGGMWEPLSGQDVWSEHQGQVEDEDGALFHYGVGDDVRVVGGLVGVAVEAGGEDEGGDAGLMEYGLVGELVEEFGEVLAAVEGVVDVQADVVVAVAHVDEAAVLLAEGILSEDDDEIRIGFVYGFKYGAYLVYVDGADNPVFWNAGEFFLGAAG